MNSNVQRRIRQLRARGLKTGAQRDLHIAGELWAKRLTKKEHRQSEVRWRRALILRDRYEQGL